MGKNLQLGVSYTWSKTIDYVSDPFATTGPIRRLEDNVGRVLRGKPEVIRLAVVSLVAGEPTLVKPIAMTTDARGRFRMRSAW